MNEIRKPFVLRMYNIPVSKTDEELNTEFLKYTVPFVKVTLARKTNMDSAGYAFIEFESQQDLDNFAKNFNKLRSDLVIYHE